MKPIKIALTKGRTEQQVIPLLEASGIDCSGLRSKGRRLIFDDDPRYEIILVKGPDVLTYLNSGSVQIGIVGSDVLDEQGNRQYAMLNLSVGKCRFVLASTEDFDPQQQRRKIIATKYPNITKRYFQSIGEDVEIIKIEGSVELAPLIGLADAIVDIVETGNTLKENNLHVYAKLQPVNTKLVVNRLALRQSQVPIKSLITSLQTADRQIKQFEMNGEWTR
ncbi:MAG: ATP phosphoribosyltransferase [Lentilactobacillus diolivorans]|mgnify:CR=1 FL=1|jgi:ATP phosphoribosyltransferase|uniref:ATP phosphoribosyltransferase n=2 Tax=Lentilactobacillus diolivorans TaxID=179838 RepID=A0A0R1S9L4_9LACO|nr:ATP phosphoribosyltransferase [Lentilactobacillus diolivorans]RRG01182.1 MAG: ATP phosphoribosyltransferase [Lactobacillus sp.]KRL65703.1 ATP phosphoribosyltransferase (ATP-PRTase) (ATP-PRT) [Lentilactobacillus diolivorans DSM 14421]MCH4165895.1 ATP phosphoribosyltransferase [Lentilactobacillus diolivorans]MDH5105424.1 ATP phosphoribosyltransferase [Lentilactobacillus diolivorans]GEP24377.1 ATP phosphoribosyltransferase [Lentilactobacillus diolivorans]